MKAVLFIIFHQMKNQIKRIFSRPLSAIITVIACLAFIGGPLLAFLSPKSGLSDGNVAEVLIAGLQLFIGITLINAYLSQQSGLFTLADANFMFSSPINRRTILVYLMIQTAPSSLLTAIFMSFYYPFLIGSVMSLGDFLATLFIMSLMFGCIFLSYYYIYIEDIAHPGLKKRLRKIMWIVLAVFAVIILIVTAKNNFDFITAITKIVKSTFYNLIPIFGWAKYGVISAVNGDYAVGFLLSSIMLLAFNAIFAVLMYKSEVDFYEQAQQDSIKVQEMMDSMKSGNLDARKYQINKIRKANVKFKPGAAALLSRQMLEYKKSGSFITIRELIVGLIYIVIGVIAKLDFSIVMVMIVFGALSFSSNDSWNADFKKHYVFLIPDSSVKKVIYSVVPGLLKTAISGLVAFIVGALAYKLTFSNTVYFFSIYISYILIFTFAGVYTYRILGKQVNAMALMFLRMLMLIVASLPASVIIVVMAAMSQSTPDYFTMASITCLVNILESGLLIFLSRRLFEQSEFVG